jgi:outer membrane protein assembly factor BamB
MRQPNALFILSNGRLAAINKKTGEIIWEVKLKQYLSNKLSLTIGHDSSTEACIKRNCINYQLLQVIEMVS